MTNINRHQAGATVAGEKTGGQFKAGARTAADGSSLGAPGGGGGMLERARASAARLKELDARERELRRERDAEALRYAGFMVLAAHPDATEMVLGTTDDPGDTWVLAEVRGQDGEFIELTDGLREEVTGCFQAEGYRPAPGEALDYGDTHEVGDDWSYATTVSVQEATQDPEPKPAIDLDSYERDSDGRLTKGGQAEALADIATAKYREQLRLNQFQNAEHDGANTAEDHDAWNATHDRISELEALRAEATINRGHVAVGSSEWLAMNNID